MSWLLYQFFSTQIKDFIIKENYNFLLFYYDFRLNLIN